MNINELNALTAELIERGYGERRVRHWEGGNLNEWESEVDGIRIPGRTDEGEIIFEAKDSTVVYLKTFMPEEKENV